MAGVIDTSVLIELERRGGADGVPSGTPFHGAWGIASITVSELLVGVHRARFARRRKQRMAFVDWVIEQVPVYPFDLAVAPIHAELTATLMTRGEMVGANDLMIAATALLHGSEVLTRNVAEFQRVPGLLVRLPEW
jgi:tRNA(fMet)-specific endonuclease VapC